MKVDQCSEEVVLQPPKPQPTKKRKLNEVVFSSPVKRLLDHAPSFQLLPEWEDETNKVAEGIPDHQLSMGNGSAQKPQVEISHNDNTPLIPVRLSPFFLEQMNSGRLSKKESQDVSRTHNTKTGVDVVVLPDSPQLAATHNKENIDPICRTPALPSSMESLGEVQILRCKPFTERCSDISKKVDAKYNSMMNVTNHQGIVLSSRPSVPGLGLDALNTYANPIKNSCRKVRCVAPSKQLKDPFIPHPGRFPVSHMDQVHYQVLCRIGEKERFKNAMAIQFDSIWSSYESLSSLKPECRVDNFLISCFCRKLFFDIHPRQSKRHCFFPFIGDSILHHNKGVVETAFLGANRAYEMWFSDLLFFPICHKEHWFVFVVCIKQKLFCFLDSYYPGNDPYYQDLRDITIHNFVMLWEDTVHETMLKKLGYRIHFEDFKVTHPPVPKQIGNKNCGVFAMKFMEVWKPGLHLANVFSNHDIDNIRIQYANQLYFHNLNTADRSIVPDFDDSRPFTFFGGEHEVCMHGSQRKPPVEDISVFFMVAEKDNS